MPVTLCKTCVNPDTRPNVYLDDDGICGVCKNFKKDKEGKIDWDGRDQEISQIASWGREKSKSIYDEYVV